MQKTSIEIDLTHTHMPIECRGDFLVLFFPNVCHVTVKERMEIV